jgi:hypothetical protein
MLYSNGDFRFIGDKQSVLDIDTRFAVNASINRY